MAPPIPQQIVPAGDQQLLALFGALSMAGAAVDTRVAAESNKTLIAFREMMDMVKTNFQTVMNENAFLRERLNTLEHQNKELEALRQAEKQASDERVTALQQRVDDLALRVTKDEKDTDERIVKVQKNHASHSHQYYMTTGCGGHQMSATTGPNI